MPKTKIIKTLVRGMSLGFISILTWTIFKIIVVGKACWSEPSKFIIISELLIGIFLIVYHIVEIIKGIKEY